MKPLDKEGIMINFFPELLYEKFQCKVAETQPKRALEQPFRINVSSTPLRIKTSIDLPIICDCNSNSQQ